MAKRAVSSSDPCPCDSQKTFENCCQRLLLKTAVADTAEALMRSRYSAYVLGDFTYLRETSGGAARKNFSEKSAREWADKAEWKGLKILKVTAGRSGDQTGTVDFVVTYKENGKVLEHHEVAQFKRGADQRWHFTDGNSHTHEEGGHKHHHHQPVVTVVRESPKVGRNDPCPCGSGKKYKKCCGADA